MPIGSYWCPATCGRCKGDASTWRSVKPLGYAPNYSKNPSAFFVGGVGISVYKSPREFTHYIKGEWSPELHVGPHYYVRGWVGRWVGESGNQGPKLPACCVRTHLQQGQADSLRTG